MSSLKLASEVTGTWSDVVCLHSELQRVLLHDSSVKPNVGPKECVIETPTEGKRNV